MREVVVDGLEEEEDGNHAVCREGHDRQQDKAEPSGGAYACQLLCIKYACAGGKGLTRSGSRSSREPRRYFPQATGELASPPKARPREDAQTLQSPTSAQQ